MIKKWLKRILATIFLIAGLLLIIILNPGLSYAGKTSYKNYRVYHNKQLEPSFLDVLDKASDYVSAGEFYSPLLKLDICLNDGSRYPWLIEKIGGKAFARGFYDKVVIMSKVNYSENYAEINGRKWNLTELLAHEMIHCYQFNKLGFWHSNPVAGIANWKWEGYPEYVARQNLRIEDLNVSIKRYTENEGGWIDLPDGTGVPSSYYCSWLLVKYLIEIKKMTYSDILSDKREEKQIWNEMMSMQRQQH